MSAPVEVSVAPTCYCNRILYIGPTVAGGQTSQCWPRRQASLGKTMRRKLKACLGGLQVLRVQPTSRTSLRSLHVQSVSDGSLMFWAADGVWAQQAGWRSRSMQYIAWRSCNQAALVSMRRKLRSSGMIQVETYIEPC